MFSCYIFHVSNSSLLYIAKEVTFKATETILNDFD